MHEALGLILGTEKNLFYYRKYISYEVPKLLKMHLRITYFGDIYFGLKFIYISGILRN